MAPPTPEHPSTDAQPALAALTAALGGEGPAVELLPGGTPGAYRIAAAADAPEGTAAVVRTSGSTGTPKRTALTVESLAASSMATALRLGFEGQWLLALPVHYVAGLSVLTRSLFAGTRPWALDLSRGFTAEAFTEAAGQLTDRTRITSLVPTQLQRLLADGSATTLAALRRFDAILLGGGRAPDALREEARRQGLRIHLSYGMSETCGGCVYDAEPLPGVRIAAREGRIWIGGEVVAGGYLGDPELDRRHFSVDADGTRWFMTDDLGTVGGSADAEAEGPEDDAGSARPGAGGTLVIEGRVDDVVNTGGVKVSAGQVQRVAEAVPGVSAALVVGVPDEEWGTAVGILLVPHTGGATPGQAPAAAAGLREEIAQAVRTELGAAAVPRRWAVLDALPLLPHGKPDRQAAISLLERAGRE
ncbi:AMP-binding protein [Zafaria sp. Z1313]|uniref:AMP-binding protein n=1 Tax=unclassified Zafaria TaxID=2828765 RepID=UPI002E7819FA|nr:AMP-binding protein [Zafaria sp. J156]MEE1621309.1 AMP-binding protein [Zafaria sp. J156]